MPIKETTAKLIRRLLIDWFIIIVILLPILVGYSNQPLETETWRNHYNFVMLLTLEKNKDFRIYSVLQFIEIIFLVLLFISHVADF